MTSKVPSALVLAGGGARGAYEVGVVDYLLRELELPSDLQAQFDIFAGTSVGALNCSFLAAMADDPTGSAQQLSDYWREMTMGTIMRFGLTELASLSKVLLGRIPIPSPPRFGRAHKLPWTGGAHHPRIEGVFDTTPFAWDMERMVPWDRLHANTSRGVVRGLALVASEVCRGKSVVFYESARGHKLSLGSDPSRDARAVRIGAQHAMASAAIPFLFPAVQIDGFCFADGGLRQNTPVQPAIRLGAEKMLVVGVTMSPERAYRNARLGCRKNANPGLLFLLGRMVNMMLSDALDDELGRMQMFNRLIEKGQDIYGESFLNNLNELTGSYRKDGYRPIRTLLIRPSKDLNEIALQCAREAPDELTLPGPSGRVLRRLLLSPPLLESELLSFLMFTPTYISRLMELGRRDAHRQRDELQRFFAENP